MWHHTNRYTGWTHTCKLVGSRKKIYLCIKDISLLHPAGTVFTIKASTEYIVHKTLNWYYILMIHSFILLFYEHLLFVSKNKAGPHNMNVWTDSRPHKVSNPTAHTPSNKPEHTQTQVTSTVNKKKKKKPKAACKNAVTKLSSNGSFLGVCLGLK